MAVYGLKRLVIAVGLVLVAVYAPNLNIDNLVRRLGDETPEGTVTAIRVVVAVVGVVLAIQVAASWMLNQSGERRKKAIWFGSAAAALLAAIYLPQLRAEDAVGWLWGTAAEDPDKAAAVSWARWVLVALAGLIVVLGVRSLWRELGVFVVAALVFVAAAGTTNELVTRLDRPAEVEKTEAAFDRGFAVPADKVQRLTRELKRDRCIDLIVVEKLPSQESAEEDTVSRYEPTSYRARLVSGLKAGPPSGPVEIELASNADANAFATALVTASAIFILSTAADQERDTAPRRLSVSRLSRRREPAARLLRS